MSAPISLDQRKECGLQDKQKWAKNLGCLPKACECKHELEGTGAVFFQSEGYLFCNNCRGIQVIKRPIK
ncbi:hypothetical protein D3C85_1109360 [compost metagenome]